MNARETMIVQGYAQSFVEKIGDHEQIWEIYDQLGDLRTILRESKLNRLLLSATVSHAEKAAFLRTLRQSNFKPVNDLIEDLIRGDHMSLLGEILLTIQQEISKVKNEFDAQLVSVYPLTDEQKKRLCRLVEERFSLRVRNMIEELDSSLIGGFIVTVNHKVIDASVRTQLQDVRSKL